MPKYDVTPELAETIKTVRIQNRVPAKSVAEHIGKSQSYLSKLENGDIKTIKEEELIMILRFIFGNDKDFQAFLDSAVGTIFETLERRFTDEEIAEQLWLGNFDTVMRQIPVPNKLIDYLNQRMQSLGLSIEGLCERINANEGIFPEVNNTDDYPFNEWQAYVINHKIVFQFIKMRVTIPEITQILQRNVTTANYVSVLAIAYYITKIEKFGTMVQISDDDNTTTMKEAVDCLNAHGFFSIAEKNKLRRQAHSDAERNALLSTFDKENISLVNSILQKFGFLSDYDIANTNKYLTEFNKNLEWDMGFIMRLLSIRFFELDNVSFALKKQLLSEIEEIVQKYKEMPGEQKRIESYE